MKWALCRGFMHRMKAGDRMMIFEWPESGSGYPNEWDDADGGYPDRAFAMGKVERVETASSALTRAAGGPGYTQLLHVMMEWSRNDEYPNGVEMRWYNDEMVVKMIPFNEIEGVRG